MSKMDLLGVGQAVTFTLVMRVEIMAPYEHSCRVQTFDV